MNKNELIDAIASEADLPKAAAGRALDAAVNGAPLRCHRSQPSEEATCISVRHPPSRDSIMCAGVAQL